MFASAIAACFIPVFSEFLEKKGRKEAFRFAGNFITVMALLTGALTLIGMLFPQALVALFADYADPATTALAASLTGSCSPRCSSPGWPSPWWAFCRPRTGSPPPALMSAASNLVIIVYFLFFDHTFGIYGLAGAYLLGLAAPGADPAALPQGHGLSVPAHVRHQ